MNLPRLLAAAALLSTFTLVACGNKADLYLPPPPEEEEVDDWDDWDDEGAIEESVIEDEAASQQDSGMPLPPPTSAGPDLPALPPADDGADDETELPLPVPTDDE